MVPLPMVVSGKAGHRSLILSIFVPRGSMVPARNQVAQLT